MRRRATRGFVLAELLVALVIAAIIGAALVELVVSQSRLVALQGTIMQARGGARAALNVMSADLRMVGDSGLLAATPESVTVRVPYAFGVACRAISFANLRAVGLLPADSASYFSATMSGYAWRTATGGYAFDDGATVVSQSAPQSRCNASGSAPAVTTLTATGWSARVIYVTPADTMPQGAVMYLYQDLRYAFAPSSQLPGRIALWRTVLSTGQRSELVAPFDSTTGFEFLVGSALTLTATPPADLGTVRGLRLNLISQSETPPEGRSAYTSFDLTTDVLFRNHS